jgi:hypothetical protein
VKTIICSKYSFQELTQFLQGNIVLYAAACNIDGFLLRDIMFLQHSTISVFGEN